MHLTADQKESLTQLLREIGKSDAGTMIRLIDMFVEQAPDLISDISIAYKKSDEEETRRAAHTLKGVCYNLGITLLGDIALEIEQHLRAGTQVSLTRLIDELEETLPVVEREIISLKDEIQSHS